MSNKIVVTKISTMVDVFYVPDTPENRQAVERGEYDKVIYDHDGYYQHLVDSYGEEEKSRIDYQTNNHRAQLSGSAPNSQMRIILI